MRYPIHLNSMNTFFNPCSHANCWLLRTSSKSKRPQKQSTGGKTFVCYQIVDAKTRTTNTIQQDGNWSRQHFPIKFDRLSGKFCIRRSNKLLQGEVAVLLCLPGKLEHIFHYLLKQHNTKCRCKLNKEIREQHKKAP